MSSIRDYDIGGSDYSRHRIQPRDIRLEYGLDPWDADIVGRVLRAGEGGDRKPDYERIIRVCRERIRQLEAERTEAAEEGGGADYKTVVCPSEKDRPELLYRGDDAFRGVYYVYGVFRSGGRPYAYLGYDGSHTYLDLGRTAMWYYCRCGRLPGRAFSLGEDVLRCEYHAVSMEIGGYGEAYGKHDYVISHGSLYRYMDGTPGGHVYMRFEDDGSFARVVTGHKIFNHAVQYVEGDNK